MNTSLETLRSFNTTHDVQLQMAVNGKIVSRKLKGLPPLSESELKEFEHKVAQSLTNSQKVSLQKQEQSDAEFHRYEDRRDAVLGKAAELGVKFIHRRNYESFVHEVNRVQISKTQFRTVLAETEQQSNFGGDTVAFIYKLDDENNLSMLYSVAFCRDDELFDEVIGMEESLKKFIAGKLVEMPITHDRLGHPKLLLMGKDFRRLNG